MVFSRVFHCINPRTSCNPVNFWIIKRNFSNYLIFFRIFHCISNLGWNTLVENNILSIPPHSFGPCFSMRGREKESAVSKFKGTLDNNITQPMAEFLTKQSHLILILWGPPSNNITNTAYKAKPCIQGPRARSGHPIPHTYRQLKKRSRAHTLVYKLNVINSGIFQRAESGYRLSFPYILNYPLETFFCMCMLEAQKWT